MQRTSGHYSFAGRSEMRPAEITIDPLGHFRVEADGHCLRTGNLNDCREGDILPGLPVDLIFPDEDRFIPNATGIRWFSQSSGQSVLSWLESHTISIVAALILVPLFLWMMVFSGIPAFARVTAPLIPHSTLSQMGQSQLKMVDLLMEPSELDEAQQQTIMAYWSQSRKEAGLGDHYRIEFRHAGMINAFALADGTLVVTDGLVRAMEYRNDLITAVLFHEAGHIDLHHNMRMVLQSGATSLLYILMFGDMEGITEVLLGAGVSLSENAFSRDMESDADNFAHKHLKLSGHPSSVYADALANLPGADSKPNSLLELLSTHPELQERIRRANEADQN